MSEKVIKEAEIGPYPKELLDPMPEVRVTYGDGSEETLFSFYPDEIDFSPAEFTGLTKQEALQLRHLKDVKYLQSCDQDLPRP